MRRWIWFGTALLFSCAQSPARLGAGIESIEIRDVQGRSHIVPRGITVLLFTSTECPMSNVHLPRVVELASKFPQVSFFSINSNRNQSVEQVAEHAKKLEVPFPTIKDEGSRLADRFGVDWVPTAVVLDEKGVLRYRGRVDDHKLPDCVRNPDLRRALEDLTAGREVARPETPVEGCYVMREAAPRSDSPVGYTRHVAPILNRHCVGCHHADGPAPFALQDYGQASAWARSIKRATQAKRMPPWKPVSNRGMYFDERGLTDEEIATLASWADHDAPRGAGEAPAPPAFSEGWSFGTPDLILTAGSIDIEGRGSDVYRCYVLDFKFDEDRYIGAVELRVQNQRVLHHLLLWVDTSGQARKLDARDPKPGYGTNGTDPKFVPAGLIGGWAPGHIDRKLSPGLALHVPKGAALVLDTHYHKSGRAETDPGTKVGIYFSRGPVEKIVRTRFFGNLGLSIPAGAPAHEVTSHWTFQEDIHVLAVAPHMHLLGRKVWTVARLPDGAEQDLIRIDDWDFNWQELYAFGRPLPLPKGTIVTHGATYDNSERNPNNPNRPPKRVHWGEQTTDEMQLVFISYTKDAERLNVTDPISR